MSEVSFVPVHACFGRPVMSASYELVLGIKENDRNNSLRIMINMRRIQEYNNGWFQKNNVPVPTYV